MTDDNVFGIEGLSNFQPIGEGGFSSVYAAWDAGFERWVAVKVLQALDEAGQRRFDRERVIMGRLSQHRDVVTPFRFGYTDNRAPYLVMEFVSGGSLEDALRNGPLPWQEAVGILIPVSDALAFAHAEGILHRDIKPGNILLAPGGAKLADFGIAAIREATATQTAFTLAHSPPETFAGGTDARDARSDVYSMVSTLYTAVVGSPPFHVDGVDSQAAYMVRIGEHPVPDLPPGDRPGALDDLIRRGLAKLPAERPATALDLRDELQALVQGSYQPVVTDQPPITGPPTLAAGAPAGPITPPPIPSWEPPRQTPGTDEPPVQSVPAAHTVQPGLPVQPDQPAQPAGPAQPVWSAPSSPVASEPGSAPVSSPDALASQPTSIDPNLSAPGGGRSESGRKRPALILALVAVVLVAGAGAALAVNLLGGDDDPSDTDIAAEESDGSPDSNDGEAGPDTGEAGSGNGENDPDGGGPDDEEATVGDPADRPDVAAGGGGELRLLQWQAPTQANALRSSGTRDLLASSLVLEPLARYAPDGTLVPALAATIPTVENGGVAVDFTSITWTLRDDITWSDGTPFTADDVVFTWQYCADPQTGCSSDDGTLPKVEAIDPHTVRITFGERRPYPYSSFVGYTEPIIQRAQFEDCVGSRASACTDENLAPIGTGPYRITDFRPDDVVTYEWNPLYRGAPEGRPFFGTVTLRGGGDAESSARSVLEIGEADYAWNLQVAPEILAAMEQAGTGRVLSGTSANVEHINLNQTDPDGDPPSEYLADGSNNHPILFDNFELARALSMAIDREALVAVGYGPTGSPTCTMWPAGALRSTTHDWCLTQDVAGANNLLDDLGYVDGDGDGVREFTDGTPLTFDFVTSTNAVRQSNQEIIKANWAEIGVGVTMRNEAASAFFDSNSEASIWQFSVDMVMFTNGSANPDPVSYLTGWTRDEIPTAANGWLGLNFPRMQSAEFDTLWQEASQTAPTDPAYPDLVRGLQDLMIETSAVIPLVARADASALANDIGGVGELNAWDSEYWNIEEWYRAE